LTKTALDPRQPWPFPKPGQKLKKLTKKKERDEIQKTLPRALF
jgi:hypothetical protein